LRSAIMFTCIVVGNNMARQSNVLNSLAVSAFILLCYNPFWLWDAGFQLSYAAIIGIVIFMKPIYQLMNFQNRLVDMIWQMNAVTISAQLLTLAICIYQFHQFPNYFLISNIIAVPLSSLILLLEIFLCAISFLPSLFSFMASLTALLIRLMNACVERIEQLPFSVWNGLQISFVQAILLAASLVLFLSCLLYREHIRALLYTGLIAMTTFVSLRCLSFIQAGRQQMLIVYQRSADLIRGRAYSSIYGAEADDVFPASARSLFRLRKSGQSLFIHSGNYYSFLAKKIILIDRKTGYSPTDHPQEIDLVILSQKAVANSNEFLQAMNIRQVVADASVPAYMVRQWQMGCEAAGVPFHDVRAKGAFVMKF
ncbi:MAG: ComEC/Rec2 family competence protein, partial [Chitinophagaceae bacterium]|nr:ComEC/Rec2 family competence protein [Chitinophagaceae bacterium]